MIRSILKNAAWLILSGLLYGCAEMREAGYSIGNTAKNVTTDIGHGSRDTVKAIGRGTKRVAKSIVEEPAETGK